jgi:hypothetical protein
MMLKKATKGKVRKEENPGKQGNDPAGNIDHDLVPSLKLAPSLRLEKGIDGRVQLVLVRVQMEYLLTGQIIQPPAGAERDVLL